MKLHDYWRSTASYRVRIALNLKGQAYPAEAHDLRRGEQRNGDYRALNPQGLLPALEVDGRILTQSLAIIEWVDEIYPAPPLLPSGADDRAVVRAMAMTIASDIHPLNNLRVLETLRTEIGLEEPRVLAWIARWIGDGFAALEASIAAHGGRFAFGDTPGLADCCLVPQLYSAERFGVDLIPYPALVAAGAEARALPAIAAAHPDRQRDADQP